MYIGEQYKEIVENAYATAKTTNQNELILDEKVLGGIKLFIGKKPKFTLGSFVMEDGEIVYIGEEVIGTVS